MNEIKILLVEDDSASVTYYYELFGIYNVMLQHVDTGNAAIRECSMEKYDILLLDIQLEDMSGVDVLHEIRKIHADIVIIAQTAFAFPVDRMNFMKMGFDDYIAKPVLENELVEVVSKFFPVEKKS